MDGARTFGSYDSVRSETIVSVRPLWLDLPLQSAPPTALWHLPTNKCAV